MSFNPCGSHLKNHLYEYPAYKSNASAWCQTFAPPSKRSEFDLCSCFFDSPPLPSTLADLPTLRYEETVIIALAAVSMMAVVAVAAFFAYRMMHGELPWRHASRPFKSVSVILVQVQLIESGIRVGL